MLTSPAYQSVLLSSGSIEILSELPLNLITRWALPFGKTQHAGTMNDQEGKLYVSLYCKKNRNCKEALLQQYRAMVILPLEYCEQL